MSHLTLMIGQLLNELSKILSNSLKLTAHDKSFNLVFMLFNNIFLSLFIKFAQHVQYGQQQVYVRHDLKLLSSCMNESLTPPSTEVKIKLKHHDWEVEITCIEDKVKQVVENVLSGIDTSSAITASTNSQISDLKQEIDSLKLQMKSEIFHKSQLTSSNVSPHVAEKLKSRNNL